VPEHRYQQYCGAARALDVIGDRWVLLIVRELVFGPRRFTDLVDGLPGISRNLLTQRLRDLERDGIVIQQELPPPAARQVYELTDDGRDLADAMLPLVAWGVGRLGDRKATESFRPHWAALAMAAFADREAAAAVTETYQYLVGAWAFHFKIDQGSIELHDGLAREPAATLTTDEETWADIASGAITASAALASGRLTVAGDLQAASRIETIFGRNAILDEAEHTIHAGASRGKGLKGDTTIRP
jgi:DNA-binding HxlR family transcriptional regulator/putative sterol carrier protein